MSQSYTVLLLDETPANTNIGWWNTNREKLNNVIRAFNQWQINGFSSHGRAVVSAMVTACEEYGQKNEFSDWQYEDLTKMRDHIAATMDVEPQTTETRSMAVSTEFLAKLEELGEKWMPTAGRIELQELITSLYIV